jgi:uncharacterized repeat protein (TIGR03837 family)
LRTGIRIIAAIAASDNRAMRFALARFDIFCRVVDNFGDAGVAWRLARMLAGVHGRATTLWIDDLAALARIVDGVDAALPMQSVDGVRVAPFDAAAQAAPADAVIEAFGCGLPEPYLDAMERRPPVWINLEYLSAETWVDGVHGLPSRQPQRALTRWFYFPGFTRATGGLLREPDLFARRAAYAVPRGDDGLDVSVFCYANPALPALCEVFARGPERLRLRLADGVAAGDFAAWLGHPLPPAPSRTVRGALTIDAMPFVPQPVYDERLWRCDLNFVRGEDSFVRAQWAQRPLVWHIYPQQQDAHRVKLDAFLDRYLEGVPADAAGAMRDFHHAFDRGDGVAAADAWPALRAALPALSAHAAQWCRELATLPELSASLVEFAETRYT